MKRFFLILAIVLMPSWGSAATLYVSGGGFASIQSAITAANDYDVIIVSEGRYYENINFSGKSVQTGS